MCEHRNTEQKCRFSEDVCEFSYLCQNCTFQPVIFVFIQKNQAKRTNPNPSTVTLNCPILDLDVYREQNNTCQTDTKHYTLHAFIICDESWDELQTGVLLISSYDVNWRYFNLSNDREGQGLWLNWNISSHLKIATCLKTVLKLCTWLFMLVL